MSQFEKITVPADGQPVTMVGGELNVPDTPIITFIEGDGTGADIWRASRKVEAMRSLSSSESRVDPGVST